MSSIRTTVITCDAGTRAEPCPARAEIQMEHGGRLEDAVNEKGWYRTPAGRDLCPECVENEETAIPVVILYRGFILTRLVRGRVLVRRRPSAPDLLIVLRTLREAREWVSQYEMLRCHPQTQSKVGGSWRAHCETHDWTSRSIQQGNLRTLAADRHEAEHTIPLIGAQS